MSTDIRVGDLVKFTNKKDPEVTFTSRVRNWTGTMRWYASKALDAEVYLPDWDIEVLDRPLPPISDELLTDAINAWRKCYYGFGPEQDVARDKDYREAATAVINFVREYDRTNNKENA